MKKVLTILFLAAITCQMWAASTYVVGLYFANSSMRTMGSIGIKEGSYPSDSELKTGSSMSGIMLTLSSGTHMLYLSAKPKTGYKFAGWRKASGTGAPPSYYFSNDLQTSVSAFGAYSYYAYFEEESAATYALNVNTESASKGTVSGGGTYEGGANVTITATPQSGYTFAGWKLNGTGDYVSTSASWTFSMPASTTSYTAFFTSQGGQQEPQGQTDVFAAIDLGLSVKWGNMNLGSTSITSAGTFFAWGGTPSAPATRYGFVEDKDKQADGTYHFKDANDAARIIHGGDWHVPTKAQMEELVANCTITKEGNGYRFTSNINGNSIYMPMTGYTDKSGITYSSGSDFTLHYWTNTWVQGSSNGTTDNIRAWALYGTSVGMEGCTYATNRYQIRPVLGGQTVSPIVVDNKVTATFMNGTTKLADVEVVKGNTPAYSGATPTKDADNYYTYTFFGWSPALGAISENTTYTAQFNSTVRTYSVTFRTSATDENPNVKADYQYEDVITNKPEIDPVEVLEEEVDYISTFDNWYLIGAEPEVGYEEGMKVTGNMIFEPRFIHTNYDTDTITIRIDGGQGSVIMNYAGQTYTMNTATDGMSKEFIIRNANGGVSIVAAAAKGSYIVVEDGYAASKTLRALTTTTIAFKFAENTSIDLIEDQLDPDYTSNVYEEYGDKHLTVTIKTNADTKRTISQGRWATICLPFDYTVKPDDAFYDQFYSLSEAYVDASNIASLNFVRQIKLTAYVPYLITAKTDLDEIVFDDVQLTDPNDRDLKITSGNVDFVGTLYTHTISNPTGAEKTYFYISSNSTENSLKFASNSGSTVYGYRAYFHKNDNTVGEAPARHAIVNLDGEEHEMVITDDGELVPADAIRKYIQDDQLIIERNGVKYTVAGAMVE